MTSMANQNDRLVDKWFRALGKAAKGLPTTQRDDLMSELREHVAAARAELPHETNADVRTILDRLGDPDSIAAEARLGVTPPPRRSITSIVLAAALTIIVLLCGVSLYFGFARGTPGGARQPLLPPQPRSSAVG